MTKEFDISEAIKLDYKDRWICPDCKDHEQGHSDEYYDCKNYFVEDGKIVGQCCCYSKDHGKREEE